MYAFNRYYNKRGLLLDEGFLIVNSWSFCYVSFYQNVLKAETSITLEICSLFDLLVLLDLTKTCYRKYVDIDPCCL